MKLLYLCLLYDKLSIHYINILNGRGRRLLSPKLYMDVPARPQKSDFITICCLISHPSVYHFQRRSTQFCLFTTIFPNTPNLCILGSFISGEPPPITILNFAKKAPHKAGTKTYTISL